MGFLRRDDDDSQQAEPEQQAVAVDGAPAEAPHAAAYQPGSLAGIPESGRERIERMKKDVEQVRSEVRAGLVPGATLMPTGIFALVRAQNAGCAYMKGS